jgi:hypothetical protein
MIPILLQDQWKRKSWLRDAQGKLFTPFPAGKPKRSEARSSPTTPLYVDTPIKYIGVGSSSTSNGKTLVRISGAHSSTPQKLNGQPYEEILHIEKNNLQYQNN